MLISIIKRYVKARVYVAINKKAFADNIRSAKYPKRTDNVDKPYCLAFQRLIISLPGIQALFDSLAHKFSPSPIDFIFDEQGSIGEEAILTWGIAKRLYDQFAQAGRTDFRPYVGSMPIFRKDTGDKAFLPLQAADLYAWQIRRMFYKNRHIIVPLSPELKSLSSIPSFHDVMGANELRNLRQETEFARVRFMIENPNISLADYRGSKTQRKKERKKARDAILAQKQNVTFSEK